MFSFPRSDWWYETIAFQALPSPWKVIALAAVSVSDVGFRALAFKYISVALRYERWPPEDTT